jgi:arsenate reductase
MAHGFLKSFDTRLKVFSAGTIPALAVNRFAVRVMNEIGIDISHHKPENVDSYSGEEWDYVITVCDNAREICPVFTGKVKTRLHIPFEDPAEFAGNEADTLFKYRQIRDEIRAAFLKLYNEKLK